MVAGGSCGWSSAVKAAAASTVGARSRPSSLPSSFCVLDDGSDCNFSSEIYLLRRVKARSDRISLLVAGRDPAAGCQWSRQFLGGELGQKATNVFVIGAIVGFNYSTLEHFTVLGLRPLYAAPTPTP